MSTVKIAVDKAVNWDLRRAAVETNYDRIDLYVLHMMGDEDALGEYVGWTDTMADAELWLAGNGYPDKPPVGLWGPP